MTFELDLSGRRGHGERSSCIIPSTCGGWHDEDSDLLLRAASTQAVLDPHW